MSPDDRQSLLDMFSAATSCQRFARLIGPDQLSLEDPITCGILYKLIVLGEAAKRLSREFRSANESWLTRTIPGLRDVLIHAYDETDFLQVWEIVQIGLPSLLDRLQIAIKALDSPRNPEKS